MRRPNIITLLVLCLYGIGLHAQYNDCTTALPICDDRALNFSSSGPGMDDFANPNNDNGCLLFGEHQSLWLVVRISELSIPGASLSFTIDPINPNDDFDFAVYGPASSCGNLGSPIRCSYANATLANCGFCPRTGVGYDTQDLLEGATGDGFVANIQSQPNEIYYILIDNFTASTSGFNMTWTGGATLDCDQNCFANSGTYNTSPAGTNLSLNQPAPFTDPANYILCYNDAVTLVSDENYTLPNAVGGEEASLMWALYTAQPPAFPSPADASFSGKLVDGDFINEINSNGANSFLPNGVTLTNNTLWVLPVTGDDGEGGGNPNGMLGIDTDGDGCYNYGDPIAITYLNQLEGGVLNTCQRPLVQVRGGMPEFFGGTYEITDIRPAQAELSNEFPTHNETISIDGLNYGDNFSFILNDNNGCSVTISGVFEYGGPYPEVITQDLIEVCPLGTANLTASTTEPGQDIRYRWTGPGGFTSNEQNPIVAPALPGQYSVVVEVDGCPSNPTHTQITLLDAPSINQIPDQVICADSFDLRTLNLVGSNLDGATLRYYKDSNGGPGVATSPIAVTSGTYWIEAIPVNNTLSCNGIQSVEVFLGNITAEINFIQNLSCFSAEDGAINVNVFGGLPPYTYSWTGTNATTEDVYGLSPGNYELTITDATNCQVTLSASVTSPDSFFVELVTVLPPACGGEKTGLIETQVVGGVGPYRYLWSNGRTTANNNNLEAGVPYSLTVTDDNGCTAIVEDITLDEPTPITVTPDVSDPVCSASNGSIDLIVSGGTGTFTYAWSHDSTLTNNQATDLPPAVYEITVTDDSGCQVIEQIALSSETPPAVTIDSIRPETCSKRDGYIGLDISGVTGVAIVQWNHDPNWVEPYLEDLATGVYEVAVTDGATGCTTTLAIEVGEIAPPEITLLSLNAASCDVSNDGAASISITGGAPPYTLNWSHDPTETALNVTGLPAGDQAAAVVDTRGCIAVVRFDVPADNDQQVIIDNLTPSSCSQTDGTVELEFINGTGPFSFEWSHDPDLDSEIAEDLPAGNYSVVATDASGCQSTIDIELPNIDGPIATSTTTEPTGCIFPDGSMDLEVTGGVSPYTFAWSHDSTLNSATATDLLIGEYTVTITDVNGCSNIITDEVIFETDLYLDTIRVVHTLCDEENGEIYLYTEGGVPPYDYTWSHDPIYTDTTATDLAPGTYFITVTDQVGCEYVDTVIVLDFTDVILDASFELIFLKNENCGQANGEILIDIDPSLNFVWEDRPELGSSPYITGLSAGTYHPEIETGGLCVELPAIVIENIPPPTLAIDSLQDRTCSKAPYAAVLGIGGEGDLTYSWAHDSTITSNILINIDPGEYSVSVSDAFGCTDSLSFMINEVEPPVVTIENITPTTCGQANGFATVSATGGSGNFEYAWSHNALLNSDTARYLLPGMYSVTVTDEEGCTVIADFEIPGSDAPELELVNLIESTCGNTNGSIAITVNNGTPPFNYAWAHDALLTDTLLTDLASGAYAITVTDSVGCRDSLTIALNDMDSPDIVIDAIVNDTCASGTGTIQFSASGGTGDLSFTWGHDPDNTSLFADSLSEGFYSIIVTDELGCRAVETIFLETTRPPRIQILDIDEAYCGDPDGSILITVEDTIAPIIYRWSHDSLLNSPFAGNLVGGSYTVEVINGNGCRAEAGFGLPGSTAPEISLIDLQPITCDNEIGSAEVLVTGGTQPFVYEWSHSDTLSGPRADSLVGGNFALYTVTITDPNECSDSLGFNIPIFDQPVAEIDTINQAHCGNNNGSAVIEVSDYALYRINSGNINDLVSYDEYGQAWGLDSLLFQDGRPDFEDVEYSNTIDDPLFRYRRVDSTGFSYTFPVQNGAYRVRLGFADSQITQSSGSMDIRIEGQTVLDNYDPWQDLGPRIAGWQTFSTTVSDSKLTVRFTAESGVAQLSLIEIAPVTQPLFTYAWSHNNNLNDNQAYNLRARTYRVTITDSYGCSNELPVVVGRNRFEPSIDAALVLDTCGYGTGQIALSTSIDPFIRRINVGGRGYTTADGRRFQGNRNDNDNGPIVETNDPIANTNDETLYQTQRENPEFRINVPNGFYTVVLYFAELDNLPPDSTNVMHVEIEDQLVFLNLDIAAAAGSSQFAFQQTTLVNVKDGEFHLSFNPMRGTARLAAFEILPYYETPIEFGFNWSHNPNLDSNTATNLVSDTYTINVFDNYGCSTDHVVQLPTTPQLSFEVLEQTDAFCSLPTGQAVVSINPGNLVINGDFSAGNLGFESDHNYVNGNTGQGRYTITDDASSGNSNFDNCGDHSPNNTLFMLVDGRTTAESEVWCQSFDVIPGIWYDIEAWATSVLPNNPAELQFSINGEYIGTPYTLSTTTCEWNSVNTSWQADTSQIRLCIINWNGSGGGNDFGIDDISFSPQSFDNTYSWEHDPGLVSDTASNLAPGTYYVSATDQFGCLFRDSVVINSQALTEFTIAQLDRPGCDLYNGKAVISGSPLHRINVGGSAFISELTGNLFDADEFDNVGNAQDVDNRIVGTENDELFQNFKLGAQSYDFEVPEDGEYEVVLYFIEPNQNNRTFNVGIEGQNVENNFNIRDEVGFNEALIKRYVVTVNDGTLTIDLTGANPILSAIEIYRAIPPNTDFVWSHATDLRDPAANNLTQGEYHVTITEENGCITELDFRLEFPENPVLSLLGSVEPAACLGVLGNAELGVEEGEPDYTFSWSHDSNLNSNIASDLTSDIYSITVTDALNCKDTLDIQLLDLTIPYINLDSLKNTVCSLDNGEIYVSATGGGGTYQFSWNHAVDSLEVPFATNLPPGDYTVNVVDKNGCTNSETYSITSNGPELAIQAIEQKVCDSINGMIEVRQIGNPTGEITYSWSHDANLNAPVATNLASGDYVVSILDSSGCVDTLQASVGNIDGPTILDLEVYNPDTCDVVTGYARLTLANYNNVQYTWSHDSTLNNPVASNLPAGIYSVSMVDANGCTDEANFEITALEPFELNLINTQDANCNTTNGFAALTPVGGNAPFTYQWSHDDQFNANSADSLGMGMYTVTVTDASLCVNTIEFPIGSVPPPTITFDSIVPTYCALAIGEIRVSVNSTSENLTYQWSHDSTLNSTIATGLVSGMYSLTVTDEYDCAVSLDLNLPAIEDAVTVQEQVELCAEEQYTYEGNVFATDTTVCYTYSTLAGCDSTYCLTIERRPEIRTSLQEFSCLSSEAGLFVDTLSAINGCDSIVSRIVDLIPADTTLLTAFTCNVEEVGLFQEQFTNSFGCDSIILTSVDLLPRDTIQFISETCDPNEAGVFVDTFQNQFGCDSMVVNTVNFIPADTTQMNALTCEENEVGVFEQLLFNSNGCDSLIVTTVELAPRDTIQFTDDTCDPDAAGIFTTALTNQFGCDSLIVTTVNFIPADTTMLTAFTCNEEEVGIFEQQLFNSYGCDSIVLTSVNFIPEDVVNFADETCDPEEAGVFMEVFQNQFGCDSTVVTTVEFIPADTTLLTATTCDEMEVGMFERQLMNRHGCDSLVMTNVILVEADTTIINQFTCNPEEVGVFERRLTNINGCDSLTLTSVELLPKDTVEMTVSTCDPSAAGIFRETYSNQYGCDSMVVTMVELMPRDTILFQRFSCAIEEAGQFEEFYVNQYGCDSLVITRTDFVENELYVDVPEMLEGKLGDTILVDILPNFDPAYIEWTAAEGLSCLDCLTPTLTVTQSQTLYVTLRDEYGCEIEARTQIVLNPICEVYAPTAFSPNGDGVNDVWQIYTADCVEEVEELMVFDRWGELVFQTNGYRPDEVNFGWDGIFRGKPMNPAVFAWFTRVRLKNGEKLILKGDLTLVR